MAQDGLNEGDRYRLGPLTSDREKTLFNAGAANHRHTPAFYYQREGILLALLKSQGPIYNPESNPKGKP